MTAKRTIAVAAVVVTLLALTLGLVVTSYADSAPQPVMINGHQMFLGLAAHAVRCSWEDLYVKAFNWYCADNGIRSTWTEAGYDTATQITQAKRLIDMGVDGLIISPWDVKALAVVMDYAKAHNVPVICTNTVVDSDYPLMFVGFGQKQAGEQLAQSIVDHLRNNVDPVGEVKGTILELSSGPGTSEDVMRGGGFHEIVDQYPGIKVITQVAHSNRDEAKTATMNVIRGGAKIDAVFAQNGSMALGANAGLKDAPGITPKDVYIATVDAFPEICDEIGEGNIDIAVDQTPAFYNPIAVYYMVKYLQEGPSALPDYGQKLTAEDLPIDTGIQHMGLDPWETPMWAPGTIRHMTDFSSDITHDYRWFQTNAVVVTKDNYDSPLLWGNFPLPGW
ncbi:sugar ABC transporter substrate-binding protein [Candidatus Bipolaricaulota bacterium]|nr:sugar ABC transporter substrate-binding protein [Candidatus Bipolaricaulota bacterium]